jgi:hypothetical protein
MLFIHNKKNVYNQQVFDLIKKSDEYNIILDKDYWFILCDNKNNIIAECSVIKDNEFDYEINDVFVEEKYRGNNYSELLLMNVLIYFEEINKEASKQIMMKICTETTNIAALKTYKKIFGEPYRYDLRYTYFYIYL